MAVSVHDEVYTGLFELIQEMGPDAIHIRFEIRIMGAPGIRRMVPVGYHPFAFIICEILAYPFLQGRGAFRCHVRMIRFDAPGIE
jgi:hypothetical protein